MEALKFMKLDLKVIRSQLKVFFIYPVMGVVFILIGMNDMIFILGYMILGFSIMATTPFSMEYTNSRNVFYFTLPASMKSMVMGRYLVLLLIAVMYGLMSLLLTILSVMNGGVITGFHLFYFSVFTTGSIIICLIQYTLFFKLGVFKSQQFFSVIQMLPGMAVWLIMSFGGSYLDKHTGTILNVFEFGTKHLQLIVLAEVILVGAVFALTYHLSNVICNKKEI